MKTPGVYVEEIRSAGPPPVTPQAMTRLAVLTRAPLTQPVPLRRGSDLGALELPEGPLRAGLRAFFAMGGTQAVLLPSPTRAPVPLPEGTGLVAMPDADGDPALLAPLAAALANTGAMLLLDSPQTAQTPQALTEWRESLDGTADMAAYAPWLVSADGEAVPPSLAAAGVIARFEATHGIWKSPAGATADIRPLKPAVSFNSFAQQRLNPLGINLFRTFERGSLLFGARTLSPNPDWRYLNIRRTMGMIERTLRASLGWVAHERNAEPLWAKLRAQAGDFLFDLWRAGALAGATADQASFVTCGQATMSPADIAAGRLVLLVGVALLKPAEFRILRIEATTAR